MNYLQLFGHEIILIRFQGSDADVSVFFVFGAVVCIDGTVRLSGGADSMEGRVEVCWSNQWQTLCDTTQWTDLDASVVCIQLGLPSNSE